MNLQPFDVFGPQPLGSLGAQGMGASWGNWELHRPNYVEGGLMDTYSSSEGQTKTLSRSGQFGGKGVWENVHMSSYVHVS